MEEAILITSDDAKLNNILSDAIRARKWSEKHEKN